MAETPARSFRILLFEQFKEATREQGDDMTAVLNEKVVEYLREHKPEALEGVKFSVRRGQ